MANRGPNAVFSPPSKPPRRSSAERREALAQANEVRKQRGLIKADLKRGAISIAALLRDPPACLDSARVTELLMTMPGCGPVKAARFLQRHHVSPRKRVAGLGVHQRERLIKALENQRGFRGPAAQRLIGSADAVR